MTDQPERKRARLLLSPLEKKLIFQEIYKNIEVPSNDFFTKNSDELLAENTPFSRYCVQLEEQENKLAQDELAEIKLAETKLAEIKLAEIESQIAQATEIKLAETKLSKIKLAEIESQIAQSESQIAQAKSQIAKTKFINKFLGKIDEILLISICDRLELDSLLFDLVDNNLNDEKKGKIIEIITDCTENDQKTCKVILQILNLRNDQLFLKFDYVWNVSTETAKELENYNSRGLLINSDPDYEGSPIELLERFVLDRVNSLSEYIGKDLVIDNDVFSKLFFAIVAPSMTGKTQAAFAFKRLRPLYFLLSESSIYNLQEVYKNFNILSEKFRNCIDDDFKKLKRLNLASKYDIFNQISSTALVMTHSGTKFKTLGFIYSMIIHGEEFDNNRSNYQTWMNFYAKSPRHFTIEEKSLLDIKGFNFGNYVLFFDEFEASVANAFVRNLFRTALVPVFAANTNSNAANLVGKSFSASSRIKDISAWSLAAIKLNSINRNILTGMHPLLISNISTIISRSLNPIEKELIQSFFDDFFKNQLSHLRPGFADIIATKIDRISTQSSFTLNSILHGIVNEVSFKLVTKKPAMKGEIEGILGSLALFMDNAYLSSDISHDEFASKIGHIKSYLQHHFYYLINPVDVKKWCFLTYRPNPGSKHLRVIFQNNSLKDWTVEYTYFRAEEIIPLFACQAIFSSISIPKALRFGLTSSNANALTTGRASNTSQRVPLMGEELEVLSSICIVEASQHDFGHIKSTFMGQDGESFLKNLIENLVEADDCRRNNKVKLDCSIILGLLKHIHVPFLFPAGMKLPGLFEKYFSIPQGFLGRSVNFGEYIRTKNSTQIDGIFRYFIKNDAEVAVGVCSVECKNWRANLMAKDLVSILKKAKRTSANVSLLICNSIGNSKDETLKEFASFCNNIENKYLVLKMIEISKNNFKLVPYCPGLPAATDYALVCIIIELDVINPPDRSRQQI